METKPKKKWLENIKSVGIALLIALTLRSFLIEPFKIPTPSMVPTLLVGDQLFVNKFVYGLRIPFTKTRFWKGRDPQRGEVIIFIYPRDERYDYIKRVVGLPGDTIRMEGDQIFVNGEPVKQELLSIRPDPKHSDQVLLSPPEPFPRLTTFSGWEQYRIYREQLGEKLHLLQHDLNYYPDGEIVVPEGHYFVMGDNRDHSADSREWGFVPRENIKGRALFIWLSFDWDRSFPDWVRWHRFGRPIK